MHKTWTLVRHITSHFITHTKHSHRKMRVFRTCSRMNQSTAVVSLKEAYTGPQHSTTKQLISFHALLFLSALNSAEQTSCIFVPHSIFLPLQKAERLWMLGNLICGLQQGKETWSASLSDSEEAKNECLYSISKEKKSLSRIKCFCLFSVDNIYHSVNTSYNLLPSA